jgi:Sensors of blue-light using FAD
MLVRLLYASTLINGNDNQVIDSILAQSRLHNPALGITGVLVYSDGVFLQALEGGRAQVSELYNHIVKDTRHTHVTLLTFEEITERRFGSWTMGQVNLAKVNANVLLKYSKRFSLTGLARRVDGQCCGNRSVIALAAWLVRAFVMTKLICQKATAFAIYT